MASRAPSPTPPRGGRTLVDAEGLRCEVRSMRSVPQALYSTPAVSHVVASYVRQLISDFSRSLLLCRRAKVERRGDGDAAVSSAAISAAPGAAPSTTAPLDAAAMGTTTSVATLDEEEETYLLLRLCALHRAHASGGADSDVGAESASGKQTSASTALDDTRTRADIKSASSLCLPSASVTEQLIELFAEAERARYARSGACFNTHNTASASDDGDNNAVVGGAIAMPPLLASLHRFKPMLHDMLLLATHLLLPRHAWQHHQREWVFVCEDVTVTLLDRLGRYRRAAAATSTARQRAERHRRRARHAAPGLGASHEEGEFDSGTDEQDTHTSFEATPPSAASCTFPLAELEHLWYTLWGVLGAAWRQRDRLWGAYRYLHGPRQLPPLCLSGAQAPYGVPPSVHAAPAVREQYARYITRLHASEDASAQPQPQLTASSTSATHAEDSCAFGPFTSADVGVSAERRYVLRHPLAAVLRTLRVAVPPAGRDALVTSTSAFAGFKYVEDPAQRGAASPAAPPTTASTPLVVPLFDITDQDAALARAVPYLSPEVYVSAHRQLDSSSKAGAPSPPPVHAVSDDVWNCAVVALEAALSGFDVANARACHLAPPTSRRSADADACGDVGEASTVYAAVLHSLTHVHALPQAAAYNYLYAALYHFQLLVKGGCGGAPRSATARVGAYDDGDDSADDAAGLERDDESSVKSPWQRADSSVPAAPDTAFEPANSIVLLSPARLAREWRRYLRRTYGSACLRPGGVVAELACKGLSWRRSERWNAFGMAHVTRKEMPRARTSTSTPRDGASPYAPLRLPDNRAMLDFPHVQASPSQQQPPQQQHSASSSRDSPSASATGTRSGNGNGDSSNAPSSSAAFSASASPLQRDGAAGLASTPSPHTLLVEVAADANASGAAAGRHRHHPDVHLDPPSLTRAERQGTRRTATTPIDDDVDNNNRTAAGGVGSEEDEEERASEEEYSQDERSAARGAARRLAAPATSAVTALSGLALLPHSPYSLAANSPTLSASTVTSPLFYSARAAAIAAASAAGTSPRAASAGMSPLTQLPPRQDRVFSALDAPLLRLLSVDRNTINRSGGGAGAVTAMVQRGGGGKTDVWMRLASYLRRCTTTAAVLAGGGVAVLTSTAAAAAAGGGGAVGKANGAVAEAADVDRVDELLRLLFRALVYTTQRSVRARERTTADAKSKQNSEAAGADPHEDAASTPEWVPYAAINHPFFRGVVERGLLTTYMMAAGFLETDDAAAGGGGTSSASSPAASAAAPLPALSLYIPASTLLGTLESIESAWRANAVALAAKGVDVCTERVVKLASSLRTLIGDDMRAWEASAAARDSGGGANGSGGFRNRQQQQQQQQLLVLMNPFVGMPTSVLPPAVHRARRAVDGVVSALEFDLALQLRHTQALRRLMLLRTSDAGVEAGVDKSGLARGATASATRLAAQQTAAVASAAVQIRAYMRSTLIADSRRPPATCAPLYPVPPTLRGEVWGCLLQVPASSRTREALLAHATHHTAARPAPHDRQLSVDIPRCHAYHPLLSASSTGSAQLQRLLKAWLYLHPTYSYWQGLDSVCAVLLTVSERDEALVLAQLNAVVERFIAHDEDTDRTRIGVAGSDAGVGGAGAVTPGKQSSGIALVGASRPLAPTSSSSARHSPTPPQPQPALAKPSMEEQLRRLTVLLRYCDPLLAHYLFDILQCMPELYAISWLLTLFSHSLPTRKVYLLWDFLFTDGRIAAVVVLCAAVMMHKRERLLSSDFSGCLAAFSSGASALNVTATVGDARHLVASLPPSVLTCAHAAATAAGEPRERGAVGVRDSFDSMPQFTSNADGSGAGPAATVASLHVSDLAAAFAAPTATAVGSGAQDGSAEARADAVQWYHSGVYLVDLRGVESPQPTREAVLGALHVPLFPQDPASFGMSDADSGVSTPAAALLSVGSSSNIIADGAGWGIVEQQERRQERVQAAQDALTRRVEDAAAAIVRAVGNTTMAALIPRATAADNDGSGSRASAPTSRTSPPWPVHPIVLKTARAPHVVLLTSGTADARELPVAHQLGVELNACGVHNVSVLAGGVASLRRALPGLLVHRAPSV